MCRDWRRCKGHARGESRNAKDRARYQARQEAQATIAAAGGGGGGDRDDLAKTTDDQALLNELARQGQDDAALLQNPNLTGKHLALIASRADDNRTLIGVGQHQSVSPATLALLSKHESSRVRRIAAASDSTPASALATLATDKDDIIRDYVAGNAGTGKRTLRTLAGDAVSDTDHGDNDETRRKRALSVALAKNPSVSPVDLASLAHAWGSRGEGHVVTPGLAGNASTPPETLDSIARNGSALHLTLSRNGSVSPETLAYMSRKSGNAMVLANVAAHPNLSDADRERLARHKDPLVRSAVAYAAPEVAKQAEQVKAQKAAEREQHLQQVAQQAEQARREQAERKTQAKADRETKREQDWQAANAIASADYETRWDVAGAVDTGADTLRTLSRDRSWEVRQAVAENPATDTEVLRTLIRDRSPEVREAATDALNAR